MNYSSNIQSVVMRRVHTINLLKPLVSGMALSILVLIVTLWGIGREVWVSRVFQNMPSLKPADLAPMLRFFELAFFDTRFIVQVLVVLLLGAVVWIAYNFVQLFRTQFAY